MAVFKDFVGQAYAADSLLADGQSCVNLFLEGIESGKGQNTAYLRETPGLTLAQTLPTNPIRGIWIGEGRMFVVAGSILYECFADNTNSDFGDVGTDGLPVQLFPNGNQLVIISAGQMWVTGGGAPVQALYPNRFGDVSTSDLVTLGKVTWIDGTKFDVSMVGFPIYIDTVRYIVASFTSATVINLTTSAGESASSPYSMALAVTGTATFAAGVMTWFSGMKFDDSMVGNTVATVNAPRIVTGFTDATHLTITGTDLNPFDIAFSISSPVFASQGAFLDGVFIANPPNSKQLNSSAINDGTAWPLLNNASKQSYPDNINSLLADHEELYVFGTTRETEIWQTNPNSQGFALARVPGNIMQHASVARFAPCSLGEGIAFLGGTSNGGTIAYRATGFIPVRVSTHAIEAEWASYPTTSDAVSFTYVDEGHEFWVITFPSGNATWVYDATAAAWHRRGWWNGTSIDRQRQMFHGYVFGNHYVGDWQNGKLYIQSTGVSTDNGVQIVRQRAAPHLNDEHKWSFYNALELLLDCATVATGIASTSGTTTVTRTSGSLFNAGMVGLAFVIGGESYIVATFVDTSHLTLTAIPTVFPNSTSAGAFSASYPARPTITLDWSDDGGYTWHAGKATTPNGVLGKALRTIWRRLGRSRDRIFRVTWVASGKTSIVNAYLDLEAED